MAKTATATLTLQVTGDGLNESAVIPQIVNAVATGTEQPVALVTGFNTINVPTNALGLVIVPPATNAATLTLKGITGDTGLAISPTLPTMLALPTGATSVSLAASAGVTVNVYWI